MRVLICGGRDYDNYFEFCVGMKQAYDLHIAPREIEVIIHGGARGADNLAQLWADEEGYCCLVFPADWKRLGNAAGPIRNQEMIDEGKPDLAIAFPGGRGTADMVKRARNAGIEVVTVCSISTEAA